MQYATISDYRALVSDGEAIEQSNIDDPNSLIVDDTHLDRALIAASNKINAALASVYGTPITPAPPDLVRICIRIARYEKEVHEVREVVKDQYDEAIVDLNAYRTGASTLIGANNIPVPLKQLTQGGGIGTTTIGQRKAGNEWGAVPANQATYPARGMNYQRYP